MFWCWWSRVSLRSWCVAAGQQVERETTLEVELEAMRQKVAEEMGKGEKRVLEEELSRRELAEVEEEGEEEGGEGEKED